MPNLFVDIAFPTAVRRVFTYHLENRKPGFIVQPGVRVWVPLRSEYAIGMVVKVHRNKPGFTTKPVARILDEQPVMSPDLLRLTHWIHKFYYCSWGEAIQAALPVGLNFVSEKRLRVSDPVPENLKEPEKHVIEEIVQNRYTLKEAQKRWRDTMESRVLKRLIKQGVVEIWEEPRQKADYRKVKSWIWRDGVNPDELAVELGEKEEKKKWEETAWLLTCMSLPKTHQELLGENGITNYTLKRVEEEGWIRSVDLPVKIAPKTRAANDEFAPDGISTLSDIQKIIFEKIRDSLNERQFKSFLLYGVTGSGKTEVYIHALKHALDQGRGGLVLVPEIALTPQTVRRFYRVFGDRIAVLHSRLNDRERFEAWQALHSGEKTIAIGPRSAVFAPVKNLGFIVVDEEHDASYKQFDPAPRYHARDIAIMRASYGNAVVVMGSATPSMVALKGAREGKHHYVELPDRPSGALPEVKILDLKAYKPAMKGPLTVELYEAVKQALARKEQIILLYNRRGYASYLQCEACGHIPESPECSVSLTYHKKKNLLLCHYSGYSRRADRNCEMCGSKEIVEKGSGTQRIEAELLELFPEARILRMDRDTTSGKTAHQDLYDQFLEGKADILIGTQLVAKGLDFPNVTVVGVISAETELAFPSFRSAERMFQMLSQVSGRAGRAEKSGRVFIQTWKPDHFAIQYARRHNFKGFAKAELKEREALLYPPFSRMVVFQFKHKDPVKVEKAAQRFCEGMCEIVGQENVLGPSPAVIEWMNRKFHWEATIKLKPEAPAKTIEKLLDRIFDRYNRNKERGTSDVRITVNVDAIE